MAGEAGSSGQASERSHQRKEPPTRRLAALAGLVRQPAVLAPTRILRARQFLMGLLTLAAAIGPARARNLPLEQKTEILTNSYR